MESIYIEATILSYLVALPAKDVVIAGHQKTTLDWWAYRRTAFECFISQVVIDEISAGDPSEVRKRLFVAGSLNSLAVTVDAEQLTQFHNEIGDSSSESYSRCGTHCRGNSPRCRILVDVELQAFGKCPDCKTCC